jgi:hypothetical protein
MPTTRKRAFWKMPPTTEKLWLNASMELQIILACNWRCVACDQGSQFSSFDFVKKGTMTMEQIQHFIDEMKSKNAYIGRIRVMGGEPTVHPKFDSIMRLLHESLVKTKHVARLEIVSNGSRPEILKTVRSIAKVRTSGERVKNETHVANLVQTPISLGYQGTVCSAPWHCGFSLNAYGYFPCSSGAGIARFEDWMIWQRTELPTCERPGNVVMEAWPDLRQLCDHCYHGLRESDKIRCGTSNETMNKPGKHIAKQIDDWKHGKKVEWKIYGQP